jgi:hypothetical protein
VRSGIASPDLCLAFDLSGLLRGDFPQLVTSGSLMTTRENSRSILFTHGKRVSAAKNSRAPAVFEKAMQVSVRPLRRATQACTFPRRRPSGGVG